MSNTEIAPNDTQETQIFGDHTEQARQEIEAALTLLQESIKKGSTVAGQVLEAISDSQYEAVV